MDPAGHNPWKKDVTMTDFSIPLRNVIDIPIAVHDDDRNVLGARK